MMKRRFIAGAMCPRCAQLDSIYISRREMLMVRACVDCDFTEESTWGETQHRGAEKIQELPTRVNQSTNKKPMADIQTIKIIEGSKPTR